MLQKHLVRLACIRHAASVHPEPGSNSPQKITLASVVYFTEFTGSTKMLFPITLQLLRCLPFERTIFYLLYNHLSRFYTDQNTDAVSFASVHQAAKHLLCVSDVRRLLSCNRFVVETKSFLFLLARSNYMHSQDIVNSKKETQP